MDNPILLGLDGFSIEALAQIARNGALVAIDDDSQARIENARRLIEAWVAEGRTIYGVTTGFGALSEVAISTDAACRLQENILKSHSVGIGKELAPEIVRAMMALKIKDLARGNSGIRLDTVRLLVELLNRGVCPVVPEKGSVGASGDLVPLAHLSLVLIGLSEADYQGRRLDGAAALAACGLSPLRLEAAEGLALINGTQAMTAIGALAVLDAIRLAKLIDIAAAMSLEVLMGSRTEFDPRIHRMRPHPGQRKAARNMERITRDSEIITSHADCHRVQDAYTLRCSPQVHGASKDAIDYARIAIETEMNASTGNPLIFADREDFVLGGNFHGQPVAMALDFLSIGVSELANISERRIERLVNPMLSGLPAFLVQDGGLNSGYMVAQYAAAALVSENKVLSHPAVVDSIPTSANKEDHVSMGMTSARKAREIVANAEAVVAIELMCAAQAMDLFTNTRPGVGTLVAYRAIRQVLPHLEADRILADDVKTVLRLMRGGEILDAVEKVIGPLY